MKNLILSLLMLFALQSCTPSEPYNKAYEKHMVEERKMEIKEYNGVINDTFMLCDNHLYYKVYTYKGQNIPLHSQYCKNHK